MAELASRADVEGTRARLPPARLPRATPSALGLSAAALVGLLDALEADGLEMHSLMVARHGQVAAEGWWLPYGPDRVHMLHSVTKALTATGVGLAVSEGRFALDDRVLAHFPERDRPGLPDNLRAMRVRDLLTQTSGHDRGTSGAVWRGIATSWIDEFLKIPVPHPPGTRFQYSSATSFMLSALVTRTTGMSLYAYLRDRVFAPLGMDSVRWDIGPEGINPGGNGASATTEDLLKLGVLHAADGIWQGRRILPQGWTAAAGQGTATRPYGLHWWDLPDTPGFHAFGAFGQYAFVFPEHDLAIAVTAAVPGSISRPDVGIPPLVWRHLSRIVAGADPDAAADALLRQRMASLAVPLVPVVPDAPGAVHGADASRFADTRFEAEPNADGLRAVTLLLDPAQHRCRLLLETDQGLHTVDAGLDGRVVESETTLPGAGLHHGYEPGRLVTAASAAWTDRCTFVLQCQYVETAFCDRFVLSFAGDRVVLDRSVNVNGSATRRPAVQARRA